jgi:CheY-like chemotaxis protein
LTFVPACSTASSDCALPHADNALKYSLAGGHIAITAAACEPPAPETLQRANSSGGDSSRGDSSRGSSRAPAAFSRADDAAAAPRQWACITIADTGVGIHADEQWRLFRPFSQVAATGGGVKPAGTGLGLCLCQAFIRQMGGAVAFTSALGVGTTFTVHVPFALARVALAPLAAQPSSPSEAGPLAGVAVLLSVPPHRELTAAWGRMAAGWGAHVAVVAQPAGAPQLRAAAEAALRDGARAALLVVDEPTLGALSAEPMPAGVVCVPAAPPAACARWRALATAAPLASRAAAAFLDLPVPPGRLLARLLDAAGAAQGAPGTPAPRPTSSAVVAAVGLDGAPLRVLVAEDNLVNQRVIRAVLARCGVAAPHIVGDGEAAVAAVRERDFDVIFMDSIMPRMGGSDAVRAIRAMEAAATTTTRRHTHIVATTANVAEEDRRECMEAGHDQFLSKPITPTAMRDVLARCVEQLAAAADSAASA